MQQKKVSLIECPRDAMQGWKHFIPTQKKIAYINSLLKVGFDTIDFGSFVSPKAIPQMADTAEVIKGLELSTSKSKLLAIIANVRGAAEAIVFDEIRYLGFPFSVSPTFQQRNANSTIKESLHRVEDIQDICLKNQKSLVVYISMGFGNPYGDEYDEAIVAYWVSKIIAMGIETISVADTGGLASAKQVGSVIDTLKKMHPTTEIGVHLHSAPYNWQPKIEAALLAGCTRFDGALKGIGGCPMAGDELVGNMDTELMIPYFKSLNLLDELDMNALTDAGKMAAEIFSPF